MYMPLVGPEPYQMSTCYFVSYQRLCNLLCIIINYVRNFKFKTFASKTNYKYMTI